MFNNMEKDRAVKENIVRVAPLGPWWLLAGVCCACAAYCGVAVLDAALPTPLTRGAAPPHRFIAEIAHEHLVNLTSIGPRVAGSYENEVLAVGVLVRALQQMQQQASPHNVIDIDLHTASGGFALSFFDGMNNAYRDVQSVVARVSAKGVSGAAAVTHRRPRPALLLNCHFDTVPDSPGASDDGAGCAVVLETLRALSAARAPLRYDVVALLNGAEENIMQASHAFITHHKWARSVRAFINIEACGSGGREVLFQAGPHDPWIVETYARTVPHPFASSLAQELFESGVIPADTDFRIFRDFGNLSGKIGMSLLGVDLAWSSNGYVYHTRLDTADKVSAAVLQRTGDNVLALAHGLLSSEYMESPVDLSSRQPVFFDVLGQWVVCVRAHEAALCALGTLLLVALRVHLNARHAQRTLYVRRRAWWGGVLRAMCALCACGGAGLCAAVGVASTLHISHRRLAFYAQPWLITPLYVLPALCASWLCLLRVSAGGSGSGGGGAPLVRGWARARLASDALSLWWALLLALCLALRVRSGFCPLQWALLPALADLAAHITHAKDATRCVWWCLGAALPMLQTCYLSLGCIGMFVPITGRAGTPPLPPDCMIAVLSGALALAATSWLLPMVLVTRHAKNIALCGLCICAATALLVLCGPLHAPYSAERPQRLMLFHTRRTVHPKGGSSAPAPPAPEAFYWLPDLDPNTPHALHKYVPELSSAVATGGEECSRWLYCGAPYYLPVLSLVGSGHSLPAAEAPLATVHAQVDATTIDGGATMVGLNVTGPSHVVVVISPLAGGVITWSSAVAAPSVAGRWNGRRVYFFSLHRARPSDDRPWQLLFRIEHSLGSSAEPSEWASVSVSGHAMSGAAKLHPAHAQLLARMPTWVAATGWGVDLHLFTV